MNAILLPHICDVCRKTDLIEKNVEWVVYATILLMMVSL